jgi:Kef-type K+ transport system membrane component KefB
MRDSELLLLLVEVIILLSVARIGGEVAARLGIPVHVGELALGIIIGPSLLGWLWPGVLNAIFPTDGVQPALLDAFSWIGIIFLVLIGGLETRLGVLRRERRAVIGGWLGGFGLPFAGGFALGMLAPAELAPAGIDRGVFALFIATAISISAIPVIARILLDLGLMQTRLGMVIVSSAIADDTVGWIVLAVAAGLASGGLAAGGVTLTFALTIGFVVLSFTFGKRMVRKALALSRAKSRTPHPQISMMLLLVFAFGAITQAIGVHLVLGAFVAAMLIGRVRQIDPEAVAGVRQVGMGFFVPIFFAYTGTKVDLTSLRGSALTFSVLIVAIACVTKILGGSLGASAGGLPRWEALAVGIGLNARGAMELVIAAIGLSLGLLNDATYAAIVLVAVLTTVMTTPLLQWCLARMEAERPGHLTQSRAEIPA